jgi:hypothetical protein
MRVFKGVNDLAAVGRHTVYFLLLQFPKNQISTSRIILVSVRVENVLLFASSSTFTVFMRLLMKTVLFF